MHKKRKEGVSDAESAHQVAKFMKMDKKKYMHKKEKTRDKIVYFLQRLSTFFPCKFFREYMLLTYFGYR
jgi:radical SAM superfamily enzyme